MATKKQTTSKATTKKAAAPKKAAARKPAAPKAAKPKKEKSPREDLVVFAFRLTEAERAAIHKTAGPARASKFVRRVSVAFAGEDEAAFRAVLKEAREAREA